MCRISTLSEFEKSRGRTFVDFAIWILLHEPESEFLRLFVNAVKVHIIIEQGFGQQFQERFLFSLAGTYAHIVYWAIVRVRC